MVYKLDHILGDIEHHIQNKLPFSIVRIGDGDLKFFLSALHGSVNAWKFRQQGIPFDKGQFILNMYKIACNNANYISSFEVYFQNDFWNRALSPSSLKKVKEWRQIYQNVGIVNNNYCNPEDGFLLFLDSLERNLFSIIKDKRICLITCFTGAGYKLNKYKGIKPYTILIPGRFSNHFNRFIEIKTHIRKRIKSTDVFLVGGGILGRGYSDFIKRHGGVAVDIGQVFDVWSGLSIPKRLKRRLLYNKEAMTFSLNDNSKKYMETI